MLNDKVCFVTGSTKGIGWAIAKLFAVHGASVILNGRNESALDERCEELRTITHSQVCAVTADACDPEAVKKSYAQIFRQFRRLDVLVNNAGVLEDALLGMISPGLIERVIGTNTIGPILHLQEASRLMSRNKHGSIINISSIIGRVGNEGQAVYSASKAAVIGLTLASAKELAPKQIRVNAIAPGFINTDMTQQLPKPKYEERLRGVRMGRIGEPEDVAKTALFLASDMSAYVTGQIIGVDGGMSV